MRNSKYWKQQFEQLEQVQNRQGATVFSEIEEQYGEVQKQLEGQIAKWYQRFTDNNRINLAQARQYLRGADLKEFKLDVQDYVKYGQNNALMDGWVKELENASGKYHISKLEALKIQTQQSLEVMFSKQFETVTGSMGDLFQNSYYHTAYELQKGFNTGWDITGLDQSQLEKVLAKPWAVDEKNFSERIWGNKQKLISEIHGELTQNIMLGADPQKTIDSLVKKMNTSKYNARRLIMTEGAYFSSLAQGEAFRELGVEQYEIVATLDSHTSDICRNLDGKHFPMKDYQPGVTAPPFHVYCRSSTAPYFDEDFGQIGKRAAKDEETGKTYYIPDDMNYQEWKETFVDGGDKSDFDIIDDDSTIHYKKKAGQDSEKNAIIKKETFDIRGGTQKLKSAMKAEDYEEYLDCLYQHQNSAIQRLYSDYADKVSGIRYLDVGGYYNPQQKMLNFSYPEQYCLDNDVSKYSTLAHEYGHFFDRECSFEHVSFHELDIIYEKTRSGSILFKKRASSCDEFLTAVRADRDFLKKQLTIEMVKELGTHPASGGVQDAIDGLIGMQVKWGHGNEYYTKKYTIIKNLEDHEGLQEAYKELGFDMSSQRKVQHECRVYTAASEMWANIMSAEVNGGAELEYVRKYLPNSYTAMIKILEGLK